MRALLDYAKAPGNALVVAILSLWLPHSSIQAAMTTTESTINLAPGSGAARIVLIRDAEIEKTLRAFAAPLFTAAGLDSASVGLHLINDRNINAFVADGMNVFLNSGLLLAADSSNQVIGVIAHETGHIAGAHQARTVEALRRASSATILAQVLAAGAVIAGGPAGGVAVIVAGSSISRGTYLQYRRTQEAAADQFAVTVLDRTDQSARGLLEFLESMAQQEAFVEIQRAPYQRTHPLRSDRIRFVRQRVANSPRVGAADPAEFQAMFRRMQAKLHGFLMRPERTFARYPKTDTGLEARYARAIAHSRRANLPRALTEINSLIAQHPEDPYFHELKGQILFVNGRLFEAVGPYETAVRLLPDAPQLRVGLAAAQIETNDPTLNDHAIENLRVAVQADARNSRAWYRLSVALGRDAQFGPATLAIAERALLLGRHAEARRQAERALNKLPQGSPAALRAEEILIGR